MKVEVREEGSDTTGRTPRGMCPGMLPTDGSPRGWEWAGPRREEDKFEVQWSESDKTVPFHTQGNETLEALQTSMTHVHRGPRTRVG